MRRAPGSVRIIGGRWRRRVLRFPAQCDIRPTPDRVRETLFNWLAPIIDGAVCVDLFAGTGALGLEALSRGASRAVFVDRDARVLDAIGGHAEQLGCSGQVQLLCADAFTLSARQLPCADLVFVDPPFADAPYARLWGLLSRCLAPRGMVYLESETGREPTLPDGWGWHRRARAGRVSYGLAMRADHAADE